MSLQSPPCQTGRRSSDDGVWPRARVTAQQSWGLERNEPLGVPSLRQPFLPWPSMLSSHPGSLVLQDGGDRPAWGVSAAASLRSTSGWDQGEASEALTSEATVRVAPTNAISKTETILMQYFKIKINARKSMMNKISNLNKHRIGNAAKPCWSLR